MGKLIYKDLEQEVYVSNALDFYLENIYIPNYKVDLNFLATAYSIWIKDLLKVNNISFKPDLNRKNVRPCGQGIILNKATSMYMSEPFSEFSEGLLYLSTVKNFRTEEIENRINNYYKKCYPEKVIMLKLLSAPIKEGDGFFIKIEDDTLYILFFKHRIKEDSDKFNEILEAFDEE